MTYQLKHAVFDELTFKLNGTSHFPSAEDILLEGCYNEEITTLLPFYMYYFHPQKWLLYSKYSNYYYINELNTSMVAALSNSTLLTDTPIQNFFSNAEASNPIAANHSSLPVALRTLDLWHTYKKLQRKVYGVYSNEKTSNRLYFKMMEAVIKRNNQHLL